MKKWRFISPLFVLALWALLTYGGIVDYVLIPYPHKVFAELWRYFLSGDATKDILPTLKRMFCGLSIGIALGVSVGILLGYFAKGYKAMEFVIDFFRSCPSTSLFPIFMLLCGLGDASRIMPVVYGSTFLMLVNTIYGVKNSEKIRIMVAETMGASKLAILSKVIFPGALPYIVTGLRIAVSTSLATTVVVEMFLGTDVGLGYRIMDSKLIYDIPNVFAALIVTGFLGYALNRVTVAAEKRIVHWSGK